MRVSPNQCKPVADLLFAKVFKEDAKALRSPLSRPLMAAVLSPRGEGELSRLLHRLAVDD
jgi:hypothetical protein